MREGRSGVTFVAGPPDAADTSARGRRIPVGLLLLLVVLAVVFAGVFPFRQMIAQERQVDLARAKHDALVSENRLLRDEIGVLESPQEVERIAREQYGLVNPGEVSFHVVTPPGEGVAGPEPVTELEPEPSLLHRIWDFLTGRDLDPDE